MVFAHPDDQSDDGRTWRQQLVDYNTSPGSNPLRLLPAYRLYTPHAYGALVAAYGSDSVFVLSAGWGLIRADFLTPYYDITFSPQSERFTQRTRRQRFVDLNQLPATSCEPTVFFGGTFYRPLFASLTAACVGPRVVVFNSQAAEDLPGLRYVRYETSTRTNWHYEAVARFVSREGPLWADVADAIGDRSFA
ncbi:MAG: hypothetical protein U0821_18015 [Chloroflexota bacterium]